MSRIATSAAWAGALVHNRQPKYKPGEFLMLITTPEEREELKNLQSDEIKHHFLRSNQ